MRSNTIDVFFSNSKKPMVLYDIVLIGTDGYELRHYSSYYFISVKHITGSLQQMRSDGVPHASNGFWLLESNSLEC